MTMTDWAEQEIKLACKRENPDWDGKSFDYGCSCYQSALKAYKSLMEDEHSGFSFNITKNILNRLLEGEPLSPITDDDFFIKEEGTEDWPAESNDYLKDANLKSSHQCPRMFSLFRDEDLNGNITYHDIDRAYCVNIDNPKDTFSSGLSRIIDEMFPITMPYYPNKGKYKVYVKQSLIYPDDGDFDAEYVPYIETPDGMKITVNRYWIDKNGMVEVSAQEYYDFCVNNKRQCFIK